MTEKIPTNKLSIYLIKEDITTDKEILKDIGNLTKIDINTAEKANYTFYHGKSFKNRPPWIRNFFGDSLKNIYDFRNSTAKAILLIRIKIKSKNIIFAIPFGHGWHLLSTGVYEERFGLKTALSIIDQDSLRKISKRNMSVTPKTVDEQLVKVGMAGDFGIDIEQDLVSSVTGNSKSENAKYFGSRVTGKDSLSLTVKSDITSINDTLRRCHRKYLSNEYKENFEWIDRLAEVKDKKILTYLNDKLVKNLINDSTDKTIWLAVPEIIEWENVEGFKYGGRTKNLKEDIYLKEFLVSLSQSEKENLNLNLLKKKHITCVSTLDNQAMYTWKVYNCLYFETTNEEGDKTFILSYGKWYEIEKDYAKIINLDFENFYAKGCSMNLPDYSHDNEASYNASIPEDRSDVFLMDRKIISHGGGHGKVEFCDIFTKDKKIIHIKRYGNSSVLSHLFFQGRVAGELFLNDEEFRDKVNKKLDAGFEIPNSTHRPIASEYEIIFAIISSSTKELKIPFFSKVNLRNTRNTLETFGYKVSLLKIPYKNNHVATK